MEEDSISHRSERSRPSTPKWWRPSYPPETYEWEEMRRKRRLGGYPWTHLDKRNTKVMGLVDGEEIRILCDNLYEPVNPPPLFGSGLLIGGDPETSSLDRHMFEIPPEIDIVTSEGLDGLDQPDSYDLGIDGDAEWHMSPHGQKQSKALFTAGIRSKDLPKYGETSSMRPLKSQRNEPTPPPIEPTTSSSQIVSPPEPDDDIEIHEEDEIERPISAAPSATTSEKKPGNLEQLKSKAGEVKRKLGSFSKSLRPKFLKRKTKETEDEVDAEIQGVESYQTQSQSPKKVHKTQFEVKEVKIHFDESIDLTPRTETSPKITKKTKLEPNMEASQDFLQKLKIQTQNREVDPTKEKQHQVEAEEIIDLKQLQAEEKAQREKIAEESKRLKIEEKQQKEKAAEEIKRIKAEEKTAKEREKEEQKRIKAEEKAQKLKEEEEMKRKKQIEQEELKKRRLEEIEETKAQKDAIKHEQLKLKQEKAEELKREKEESERLRIARENAIAMQLEQEEGTPSEILLPQQSTSKPTTPKLSKVDLLKHKIGDFKKRSKTPPPRPEPPKTRLTRGPSNELASQYRSEIQKRMEELAQDEEAGGGQVVDRTQIFVTEASVEEPSHVPWDPPPPPPSQNEEDEDWEDIETTSQKKNDKKLNSKLKGFGQKSKAIAAKTSKNLGEKVKNIGNDLKNLSGKMNIKYHEAIKDIRAQEEARRLAYEEKKKEREEAGSSSSTPAGNIFRFKGRKKVEKGDDDDDEENDKPMIVGIQRKSKKRGKKDPPTYENIGLTNNEAGVKIIDRNVVIGRGERDWESVGSRDISEERNFSTHASSGWESPLQSSAASSSLHQLRRAGVLEEIDSDEFFLRERGISEGEDEVEVNRFLVEELRQAFRPTHINALASFDDDPPSRPIRSNKKLNEIQIPTQLKQKEQNFQTFPPERPKRKQIPGYISSYVENNKENQDDLFEEEEEDEGIRKVKNELKKIEDDERYEPVGEQYDDQEPSRPQRRKKERKLRTPPPPPPQVFYNTIGGNEWMDNLNNQITPSILATEEPQPPKRSRRGLRSGSTSLNQSTNQLQPDSEIIYADDDDTTVVTTTIQPLQHQEAPRAQAESNKFEDLDDLLDLIEDEISEMGSSMDKENEEPMPMTPATVPRRKKKAKGNSLKRRSRELGQGNNKSPFFSLPRFTPRTFHIVPPSRPNRTYSTLRPKRPPRKKINTATAEDEKEKHESSPPPPLPAPRSSDPRRDEVSTTDDGSIRPSSAIMRGRPLPPPPRPPRSPMAMNDLDQETVERMLDVRHYTNTSEEEDGWRGNRTAVVEELCIAKNIPLLGREESEEVVEDVNVGIQTDPLSEQEFDYDEFEDEEERFLKLRDSITRMSSDEVEPIIEIHDPEPPPPITTVASNIPPPLLTTNTPPTQVIFPTRLHLDELEVDFLRVNELSAQTLTTEHINAPHIQLNSITATGPLSIASIISSNISTQNIETERITNNNPKDLPSIPPPSFYRLQTPLAPDPPEETIQTLYAESDGTTVQIRSTSTSPTRLTPTHPMSRSESNDDVVDLGMRIGRSLLRSGIRAINSFMEYFENILPNDPESEQKQKTHLQLMLCLLMLLLTGIFLLVKSNQEQTRWEFIVLTKDL